jgi:hypothetical protein
MRSAHLGILAARRRIRARSRALMLATALRILVNVLNPLPRDAQSAFAFLLGAGDSTSGPSS